MQFLLGNVLTLSIQQPWAWAIFSQPPERPAQIPPKDVENRTWFTPVRGWIQIHASKRYDERGARWIYEEFGIRHPDLPLGGIVGCVRLVNCVRLSASPWFCGPWGFVLADPYPLPFRPCPGQLKFFEAAA